LLLGGWGGGGVSRACQVADEELHGVGALSVTWGGGLEQPLPSAGTVLDIRVISATIPAENLALRLGGRRALKLLDVNSRRVVLRPAVVVRRRHVVIRGVIRIPKRRSDDEPPVEACAVMVM